MKTVFTILFIVGSLFAIGIVAVYFTPSEPAPTDNMTAPAPTYTVPVKTPELQKEIPLPEIPKLHPIFIANQTTHTIEKIVTPLQTNSSVKLLSPDAIAHEIHELINQYRTDPAHYDIVNEDGTHTVYLTPHDMTPLDWDSELADIALAHSEDMAANDYFEHEDLDGHDPTWRANHAGYVCHDEVKEVKHDSYGGYDSTYTETTVYEGIGENIFYAEGYSSEEIAKLTVDGWLNSEGHRENIQYEHYNSEGIGVSIIGDKVYVTEDFC